MFEVLVPLVDKNQPSTSLQNWVESISANQKEGPCRYLHEIWSSSGHVVGITRRVT